MDDIEKRRRLAEEPDFIALKRFGYSIEAVLRRHPDGAPDNVIAQALLMEEREVEKRYQAVVQKLRALVGACS